jgi:hypothetical protein
MKTWIVAGAGAVLVALAWAGVRVLRRRPAAAARRLAQLVLDVFGDEWARRLGRQPGQLRDALVRRSEPAVAREVDALVSRVDVRFDRASETGTLGATMTCVYADADGTARAELRLPWDAAPADVRAEFLRDGATTAVREWTAPVS